MKLRLVMTILMSMSMVNAWADEALSAGEPGMASQREASPPGARVAIVNIEDGAVVPTTFLVQFSVSGMGVAPAGTNVANTGHFHLLIDVAELPDPNLPLPKSEQFIHFGGGQTETMLTLPAGEHTLQVVFADYLHVPHDPVVMSGPITITVSAEAPAMP
jgi:Domain of unknown function (DUF4399)